MNRTAHQQSSWLERITGPRPAIRTVEVLPPSRADEGGWVFLTAGFVCLCVIYTLAFQLYRPEGGGERQATGGLPFQVMFRDLPSSEQRVFRLMKEGLGEALRLRGTNGAWPTADALSASEIPPFAPDAIDKSALRWSQEGDGLLLEYVGYSASGPSFLIQIQEPEPTGGEQAVPNVLDEEHELLPDGKLLHVTYWKHAPGSLRSGVITDPALAGWLQLRVASPFQVMEVQ